jgi:putative flippase GtrA
MKRILIQFTQRDAHPSIQFIKYAIAGGLATVVHMSLFFFLSWKVFPALQAEDQAVQLVNWVRQSLLGMDGGMTVYPLDEVVRGRRFILNSCIAFVFSNLTVYLINVVWVFKPGRHDRHVEVTLFFLVSIFSMAVGTGLGWALINFFDFTTTSSFVGQLFASLMINFVCRKYVVFKG